MDNKGGKHIIAIETKYTDVLVDTGLFSEDFEKLLNKGEVKLT